MPAYLQRIQNLGQKITSEIRHLVAIGNLHLLGQTKTNRPFKQQDLQLGWKRISVPGINGSLCEILPRCLHCTLHCSQALSDREIKTVILEMRCVGGLNCAKSYACHQRGAIEYYGSLVIHLFHFKNLGSLSEKRVVISYCGVLSKNVEYLTRTSV